MDKLKTKWLERWDFWKHILLIAFACAFIIYYFPQILAVLGELLGICFPFLVGAMIAFILTTIDHVLTKTLLRFYHKELTPGKQNLLKVATIILVLILFAVFALIIVPEVIRSAQMLLEQLPGFTQKVYDWLINISKTYPFLDDWLSENQSLFQDIPTLLDRFLSFLSTGGIGSTIAGVFNTLSNTFNSVWTVFLSVMFGLIAFFNTDSILNQAKLVSMGFLSPKHYEILATIGRKTAVVFTNYIEGTLLDGIILGTITALMNLILGIPYPLLTGIICGFFALIPLFGGFLSEAVCGLIIAIVSPIKALIFLVGFIVLQQIDDNVIYPSVVGKSTGLPSIYVLVAVTIGAGVAGITGMLLAIPITTVLYDLLEKEALKRMLAKDYPENTKEEFSAIFAEKPKGPENKSLLSLFLKKKKAEKTADSTSSKPANEE